MSLRLALLGDSIAFGQGAERTKDTLAHRLADGLHEHGIHAVSQVFAVPGARSTALEAQVDRATTWGPAAAVVVIGSNDLAHRTPVDAAARLLGDAVRRLRRTGSQVVVAPAPDMSIVPMVPPAMRALVQAGSQLLRARQIAAVEAAGGRVADREGSTSAAFAADRSLFSADAYHPSSAGYGVIARALLPELLAALTQPDAQGA